MPDAVSCDDFREALYLRETSPELDEHLAGCEDCRRRRERLEWIDRVIHETPVPEPSPERAWQREDMDAIAGDWATVTADLVHVLDRLRRQTAGRPPTE